jgi:hypothetical protein
LNHLGRPANEVIVRSPRAPPEVDCFDQTMGEFKQNYLSKGRGVPNFGLK